MNKLFLCVSRSKASSRVDTTVIVFVSSTGNFNIITLDHMKMMNIAFVCKHRTL